MTENRKHLLRNLVLLCAIVTLFVPTIQMPKEDEVTGAPGFINTKVYSGYLKTEMDSRKLHYIFIEAQENATEAPLTVWLNGGPGCSSLIGLMQQIGPYLVGNTYSHGESLIKNDYSWNKVSNLLFLESPAIVGFSTDTDHSINYSDRQTADDAFEALKDFLFNKASEQFSMRDLYLAGESYAGKYIPDLVVRIMKNNEMTGTKHIHLQGILVGNGVMDFSDDGLTKSQMEFLAEHNFLSHRLYEIYQNSCEVDFDSPRCKYVRYEFSKTRGTLNVYNVFEVCQRGQRDIEAIQLSRVMNQQKSEEDRIEFENPYTKEVLQEIKECPSDNGMTSYWNEYQVNYHVNHVNKTWSPCTHLNYSISTKGSMEEYWEIFQKNSVRVWLFSGDWDDQVPFPDTQKNLNKLGKPIRENWQPWFCQDDHAGFVHQQEGFVLLSVKTASHMVPQTRPKEAYQMFYNFIHNKPVNNTVPWW